MRAVPARPSRELDPISAMSWGVEPFRRDQQGKRLFEWEAFYPATREIASNKGLAAMNGDWRSPELAGVHAVSPRSGLLHTKNLRKILISLRGLTLPE
jgi:hypothetical protein